MEESNLAYLIRREQPSEEPSTTTRFELGVAAFGPYAAMLGDRFAVHIRKWSTARTRPPYITAYRLGRSGHRPRTPMIDRPSTRIAITC
ncbi:hypothetical protein [Amycolatopsis sp. lyj-112]|uniref:hypothetical protein n=1 Tax=Amycolatopsis sp. lyj-112 TaxID=2789288 RepID=UPI00397A2603